jgi:hypothetical protein
MVLVGMYDEEKFSTPAYVGLNASHISLIDF